MRGTDPEAGSLRRHRVSIQQLPSRASAACDVLRSSVSSSSGTPVNDSWNATTITPFVRSRHVSHYQSLPHAAEGGRSAPVHQGCLAKRSWSTSY